MIGDALLEHLERLLGPFDEHGERGGRFSVLEFERAYATFGLSRHVPQELVLSVGEWSFAHGALTTLGDYVLERHEPLGAGERHRLPGWNERSAVEGVLVVEDAALAPFDRIHLVRLLPITAAEAALAPEVLIERLAGVDTTDLFRS